MTSLLVIVLLAVLVGSLIRAARSSATARASATVGDDDERAMRTVPAEVVGRRIRFNRDEAMATAKLWSNRRHTRGTWIPLLPLRDTTLFPHVVRPFFVGREKSIEAIEEAVSKDRLILLAAQREALVEEPDQNDIYRVGTLSRVIRLLLRR